MAGHRLQIEGMFGWADDAEIFRRIAVYEATRDRKENRPVLGEPRKYVRDKDQK